jgi:hypothetical protein
MNVTEKLDTLADYQAQADMLALEKQALIDAVLTPEIKAQIAEIEAEFAGKGKAVGEHITALTNEIKAEVLAHGESCKGEHLQAVWMKGRTSWDTKGLDGYAVAHPEIAAFKTVGEPTVTIRKR